MRLMTWMLSAFTLSTGMVCATAAIAADLPKQGTFSGTYFASGTYKLTSIGKERYLSAWDENGLSIGNGFLDHLTWHCWGLYDAEKGMAQSQGYCVGLIPTEIRSLAMLGPTAGTPQTRKAPGAWLRLQPAQGNTPASAVASRLWIITTSFGRRPREPTFRSSARSRAATNCRDPWTTRRSRRPRGAKRGQRMSLPVLKDTFPPR